MHADNIGLPWDRAVAQALEGRPDLLSWMVANCVPEEYRTVVALIMLYPPKRAGHSPRVPEDFCRFLRAEHAELVRIHRAGKRSTRHKDDAYNVLAKRHPISKERLRDIVERRKTYKVADGEKPRARSPSKSKR